MKTAHWIWMFVGLLGWTAIVVLWSTGPSHCTTPDQSGHIVCEWANR